MYDEMSDVMLDACLRDIPIPVGLVARLKQTSLPDDDDLDDALRSSRVPEGLVDRLHAAVGEEVFDERLRGGEVPAELTARLRIIPFERPQTTWRRLAVAASLTFFMLCAYWGVLGAVIAGVRPDDGQQPQAAIIELGPISLFSEMTSDVVLLVDDELIEQERFTPGTVAEIEPPAVKLAGTERSTRRTTGDLFYEVSRGLPLDRDVFVMDALGSPQRSDQPMPELTHVRRRGVSGIDLPLVPGYDRAFLWKAGVHPPVYPGAGSLLETVTVPLSTTTDSVEITRRLSREGRKPNPSDIRIEDFIAAVDHHPAEPAGGELSLRITGAPSIFGRQRHHLLHVGVKAPRLTNPDSVHLSIVLDVSASMHGETRIGAMRGAVARLIEHMGHEDSLSFVTINDDIAQQVDLLPGDQLAPLVAIAESLQAAGGDNLALGFQSGMRLAFEADVPASTRRHVVLITDGRAKLRDHELAQIEQLSLTASARDISTTFVQLDDHARSDTTSRLSEYIATIVTPSRGLGWKLVEQILGRDSRVARRARLRVSFNPDAVLAYRLVGHGPTAMSGLGDELLGADLRSGDEAGAMFEVWLKPSSSGEVAVAEVVWNDPASGSERNSQQQRISFSQFVPSPGESTASLQVAAIAAEVGQRLGRVGSFELVNRGRFVQRAKPTNWEDLQNLASDLPEATKGRQDIQELLELVRGLEEFRAQPTN